MPAIAQLLREGLELARGGGPRRRTAPASRRCWVLAATLGLNPEGGSVGTRHRTRASEPESLHLIVERSPGADRWAYFLRELTSS